MMFYYFEHDVYPLRPFAAQQHPLRPFAEQQYPLRPSAKFSHLVSIQPRSSYQLYTVTTLGLLLLI